MMCRTLLGTLGFLLLVSSPAIPERPKSHSTPSPPHIQGRRISLAGVPNAGEVTPSLYRGAQPTSDGYRELKKMGIDIVVDLRLTGKDKEREKRLAAALRENLRRRKAQERAQIAADADDKDS